jgi:Tol biopolymer transport system component
LAPTQGVTERVTIGWDGSEPNERSEYPKVSGDGRYVAFTSTASNLVPWDENEAPDVFVWDRVRKRTIRVSQEVEMQQTQSGSAGASISADGRFVLFSSESRNLIQKSTEPFKHDRHHNLFIADLEHAWDDAEQTSVVDNGGGRNPAK